MLELRNISKSYPGQNVLADIDLALAQGEIVALLGPSGSGKSTLLSIVAGLETPDSGQVLWDGQDLAGVPPHRRGFGLMFQDYSLFPHMDVHANVAFGLQMAGELPERIAEKVAAALTRVNLSGFDKRNVHSLSGGEQQRVALARALAPAPRLLMLDEPLGSLDRALRTRLVGELADILRRAHQSSLYVTHDQEEAYAIADRIAILNAGRLVQVGSPQEIYRQPASAFVAGFLGMPNLLPARVQAGRVHTTLGEWAAPPGAAAGAVTVLLRPDSLRLDAAGPVVLNGRLRRKQFRGSLVQVDVAVGEQVLELELPSVTALPDIDAPVSISFDPARGAHIFPND